jgi:hypothetical protein
MDNQEKLRRRIHICIRTLHYKTYTPLRLITRDRIGIENRENTEKKKITACARDTSCTCSFGPALVHLFLIFQRIRERGLPPSSAGWKEV